MDYVGCDRGMYVLGLYLESRSDHPCLSLVVAFYDVFMHAQSGDGVHPI